MVSKPFEGDLAMAIDEIERRGQELKRCYDLIHHHSEASKRHEDQARALAKALEPFARKMEWPLSKRDAGRTTFCTMTGKGGGASFGLEVNDFIAAHAALSASKEPEPVITEEMVEWAHAAYTKTVGGKLDGHPMHNALAAALGVKA